MAGNVWQWVQDCYGDYKDAPTDGSAREDCNRRVVRGGSWNGEPPYLRSASRLGAPTDTRGYYLGFRVGRTLTP
jgi:formylglycine-generating enzyme required for sulfatase activity